MFQIVAQGQLSQYTCKSQNDAFIQIKIKKQMVERYQYIIFLTVHIDANLEGTIQLHVFSSRTENKNRIFFSKREIRTCIQVQIRMVKYLLLITELENPFLKFLFSYHSVLSDIYYFLNNICNMTIILQILFQKKNICQKGQETPARLTLFTNPPLHTEKFATFCLRIKKKFYLKPHTIE